MPCLPAPLVPGSVTVDPFGGRGQRADEEDPPLDEQDEPEPAPPDRPVPLVIRERHAGRQDLTPLTAEQRAQMKAKRKATHDALKAEAKAAKTQKEINAVFMKAMFGKDAQ